VPRARLRPIHGARYARCLILAVAGLNACAGTRPPERRWFPDRPVAWQEHDDQPLAHPPRPTRLGDWDLTLLVRDSLAMEIDRVLALERDRPAEDVNALDEVPCSTWYCPRNHLQPMTPMEVAAGPPGPPPRLPVRIVRGKTQGATAGFQVIDASGRRFMLKLDPHGLPGLMTASEVIGQLVFHAAGYNVPGAFVVDLDRERDLLLDPAATFELHGVQRRPLTAARVASLLSRAAHTPGRSLRAVLVPWIPGKILGGFDMVGRRKDDANDRIAHQHRRSLRASWVLFAWLACVDPSSINTLDAFVDEPGRRHVRHYFIDFGASLGSASVRTKDLHDGEEHIIEVGRTLTAFATLGFFRRPFQNGRDQWRWLNTRHPRLGWFPAERFDPEQYRSNRKVPSHARRTDRDVYWGAKLVTSFSDEQIAALVAAARLTEPQDAAYLTQALRSRRDIIGRRYLRALTALERPELSAAGDGVCFDDLVVRRGYARAGATRYAVVVTDGRGQRLLALDRPAAGARTCVPIAAGAGGGYRIVEVAARRDDDGERRSAHPSRVHLRWRPSEERFVVVGLERDE
jgi:hypothetical protein